MATEVRWRGGRSLSLSFLQEQQQGNSHRHMTTTTATDGNVFVRFGEMRTRDLLGPGFTLHKEIDLDVEPPMLSGWEKRLDMKSGKVYFHNCNGNAEHVKGSKETVPVPVSLPVQDLNFPPPTPYAVIQSEKDEDPASIRNSSGKFCELEWLSRFMADRDEPAAARPLEEHNFLGGGSSAEVNNTNGSNSNSNSQSHNTIDLESGVGEESENPVELKLKLGNLQQGSPEWQSVCTLDKVKMALKRAEKETGKRKIISEIGQSNSSGNYSARQQQRSRSRDRYRSPSASPSPSASLSACSSLGLPLQKQNDNNNNNNNNNLDDDRLSGSLLAAGCPRCLLYVLLPKSNPKCPRCGYFILADFSSSSSSLAPKRARLNPFDMESESATASNAKAAAGSNGVASSFLFDLNTAS